MLISVFITACQLGAKEDIWTERDEMTGDCRKLHNEELLNLYPSLSIITMIKTRRMRWAGHVARRGRRGYRWESQNERDY
jgi:hypothetical protein